MKKVLIIINVSKDDSMALATQISLFLKERNIESDFLSYDGFCDDTPFNDYDFVITLGGDGTVLYAARNCVAYDVPIFSVNFGKFGFIASIQQSEWKQALLSFLDGKAPFQERCMLNVSVLRNEETVSDFVGLNDVVIGPKTLGHTAELVVKYNDVHLCKLVSDGVIISTPTGSTAYSSSAGGPIVDPVLDAFVMTPMNSFSLSSRPIVLSSNGIMDVFVQPCRTKELSLIIDGQEMDSLRPSDCVRIKKVEKKIKLICSTEEKFYNALRSKLNWRGEPYA
ncbi:MAG: NAD(+)/NADH kinase [Treponema sp.]|nr:NAD(+)/NADH kinase [Treponema sp.]